MNTVHNLKDIEHIMVKDILDKLTTLFMQYAELRYMSDYESCYDDKIEELSDLYDEYRYYCFTSKRGDHDEELC